MRRQILLAAFATAMLILGTTTKAHAWGGCRYGYSRGGYGGAYHSSYGGYDKYGGYSAGRSTTVSDNSVTRTGYASGGGYGGGYAYHSSSGGSSGGYACGGYSRGSSGYSAGAYRAW